MLRGSLHCNFIGKGSAWLDNQDQHLVCFSKLYLRCFQCIRMYAQILSCTTYRLSKDRRLRELCRTVGCACVAHNQIQWSRRFQESLRVQSAFDVMKNPVVRGLQKKRALELGFHCAMPDDRWPMTDECSSKNSKNQKSKINPLSVAGWAFSFLLFVVRHVYA